MLVAQCIIGSKGKYGYRLTGPNHLCLCQLRADGRTIWIVGKDRRSGYARFVASIPALDMRRIPRLVLFVDPLQCTGSIFAGSIQLYRPFSHRLRLL